MKKIEIYLVLLVSIATFLLVYTPHYNYPFPSHLDEWHHISETILLQSGEYFAEGIKIEKAFRIGFHFLLLSLSKITDLVLIYRFFPAIWAVFAALVLFFIIYKTTAIYAISQHMPVATYFFYGNREECKKLFSTKSCKTKQEILNKYNIKYVLSKSRINCGWKLIYDKENYI